MIQNSRIRTVSWRISGLIKAVFVGGTWPSFQESSGKCLTVGQLPYSIVWDYTFQKRTRTRERNWRRGLYAQVMMSIINKMGSLWIGGLLRVITSFVAMGFVLSMSSIYWVQFCGACKAGRIQMTKIKLWQWIRHERIWVWLWQTLS